MDNLAGLDRREKELILARRNRPRCVCLCVWAWMYKYARWRCVINSVTYRIDVSVKNAKWFKGICNIFIHYQQFLAWINVIFWNRKYGYSGRINHYDHIWAILFNALENMYNLFSLSLINNLVVCTCILYCTFVRCCTFVCCCTFMHVGYSCIVAHLWIAEHLYVVANLYTVAHCGTFVCCGFLIITRSAFLVSLSVWDVNLHYSLSYWYKCMITCTSDQTCISLAKLLWKYFHVLAHTMKLVSWVCMYRTIPAYGHAWTTARACITASYFGPN